MNPVEIIKHKRNGHTLSREQLEYFINGYLSGEVTDYQKSAFLMAIYFKGMNEEESFHLTDIMLRSGEIIDLFFIKKPKIDKHSTGGVGDKTSLILAPQAASLGIAVPMISGRGLGHTGGTLDKLKSIPGFRIDYSIDEFKKILSDIDLVMIGQTDDIVPADRKMYSLRDVTATVESIPLIASSIMSKKLAGGADAFVFDVKIGCGANLPDKDESVQLAKKLISIAKQFGKKAIAVLTDMEQPLGNNIGNWLEVEECLEVMNGGRADDLLKVNNVLAGAMIFLASRSSSMEEGEKIAQDKLDDGSSYKKFLELVDRQEGSNEYVKDWKNLKRAKYREEIIAEKDGYITGMKAYDFGFAAIELGAGRKKMSDKIDPLAGIILKKKEGDKVKKGEVICELFAENEKKLIAGEKRLQNGVAISDKKPAIRNLILDILME
jgi:pyrimidine-nucleoside phosphorylase